MRKGGGRRGERDGEEGWWLGCAHPGELLQRSGLAVHGLARLGELAVDFFHGFFGLLRVLNEEQVLLLERREDVQQVLRLGEVATSESKKFLDEEYKSADP